MSLVLHLSWITEMKRTVAVTVVAANLIALITWWLQPKGSAGHPRAGLQCGHWAIVNGGMLIGVHVTPDESRRLLGSSPAGHSFAELKVAFGQLGIEARYRKIDYRELPEGPDCRVVQLKNPDHFVVCFLKNERGLYCFDAQGKRVVYREADYDQHWTGNTLELQRIPGPDTGRKGPSLQFARLYHDSGDLADSTTEVEMEFPFVNRGREPLKITRLATSCSCMKATAPEGPIAPGAGGVVRAKFRVLSLDRFVQTIDVTSNDPDRPLIVLTASAGRTPWATSFPSTIRLGKVVIGDTKIVKLSIKLQHKGIRLISAECPSPAVKVHMDELFPQNVGGALALGPHSFPMAYTLTIAFGGNGLDQTQGAVFTNQIILRASSDDLEDVQIPIAATIVPAISISPKIVRLDETGSVRLSVINERGRKIEIAGTDGAKFGLDVRIDKPGDQNGSIASLVLSRSLGDSALDGDRAFEFEVLVRESDTGSPAAPVRVPVVIGSGTRRTDSLSEDAERFRHLEGPPIIGLVRSGWLALHPRLPPKALLAGPEVATIST